jgi:DNA ligase-1
MQDVDLAITGFEEGSGRLKGTLGRINVEYKGNTLGVGAGFSDEQRKWFWENKDNLIGRVISVQYFEETQNANGVPSLRFPVFKELREEGKEVSYS